MRAYVNAGVNLGGVGDPAQAIWVLVLLIILQVCDHSCSSLRSTPTSSLVALKACTLELWASQVSRRLYASARLSWFRLNKVCCTSYASCGFRASYASCGFRASYASCAFLLSAMIQAKSLIPASLPPLVVEVRELL